MNLTKRIDDEWVVGTDLESYTQAIETNYKYNLLRDAIVKSLEYCSWSNNKMSINSDKVLPILNAIEPVAYHSILTQLTEKNATENKKIEEKEN